MQPPVELFGRMHPIVVHLPVTLLVIGGVVEIARLRRESGFLIATARWCFALGAAGAIVASISGWILAGHGHHLADERQLLENHRWLGVITAGLASAAWAAHVMCPPQRRIAVWTRRLLSWSAALVTVAAGHVGALVVWGSDWFS